MELNSESSCEKSLPFHDDRKISTGVEPHALKTLLVFRTFKAEGITDKMYAINKAMSDMPEIELMAVTSCQIPTAGTTSPRPSVETVYPAK
jgi:hypothetical protein